MLIYPFYLLQPWLTTVDDKLNYLPTFHLSLFKLALSLLYFCSFLLLKINSSIFPRTGHLVDRFFLLPQLLKSLVLPLPFSLSSKKRNLPISYITLSEAQIEDNKNSTPRFFRPRSDNERILLCCLLKFTSL